MRTREFVEKRRRGVRPALRLIVFGSIFFLGVTPTVHAEHRNECTQGSLKGSYGYVFGGPLVGVGPVAAAGLIAFDGEGGLTARDTLNNSVVISRRTGTGTFTVNSNCTGSAELGGEFGGLSFDFMIVPGSGGSELSFLVTNPGTVQSGVALATGDKECALATFKGTYRNVRADTRFPIGALSPGLRSQSLMGWGIFSFHRPRRAGTVCSPTPPLLVPTR